MTGKRMQILFLSSGDRVPSARFRILPYVSHFRAEGHRAVVANSFPQKYDYFPWMGFRPSQLLKRSVRWWHWLKARLSSFDVVFIDREIFDDASWEMETRFRQACGRLVLDLDDAVFLRQPQKFQQLLQLADLVVCGNRFLEDKVHVLQNQAAAAHNPVSPETAVHPAPTLRIPTCVDMQDYGPRADSGDHGRPPVVGWMGTTGNLPYLNVAAQALRTVAADTEFELRIIVPDPQPLDQIDLQGVNVVHEPWQPAREVAQLQALDIGLMPLFPDQEWDIYKCGLKLIQYLAVGVPGIAAPVGVNSEIIDDNRNGFTAQTTQEWTTALRRLLTDAQLRHSMGARGRETVIQRYSIQANYPVLRDGIAALLADR